MTERCAPPQCVRPLGHAGASPTIERETLVIERRPRRVTSYAKGSHMPEPYQAEDGWRCRDCRQLLMRYRYDARPGEVRLRHRSPRRAPRPKREVPHVTLGPALRWAVLGPMPCRACGMTVYYGESSDDRLRLIRDLDGWPHFCDEAEAVA